MARGFGSTFGTGTDYITTSASFSLPSLVTLSFWTYLHGTGTFSAGNIFEAKNSTAQDFLASLNGSTTAWRLFVPWSTTAGAFTWSSGVSTSAWQHMVIAYDGSSTSNKPLVYINGSAATVSTATAPVGTFGMTASNFRIGKTCDNAVQFDGKIAELALWNGILTSAEAAALAKGLSPLFVRPTGLNYYWPLRGTTAGEADWGPTRAAQTLTGTVSHNHAPVSLWMPPSPAPALPFHYSGGLALTRPASTAALAMKEKFRATAGLLQTGSSLSAAGREKFSGLMALAANANQASIHATANVLSIPGHAVIGDAAQGGRSALADTALYRVRLTESV